MKNITFLLLFTLITNTVNSQTNTNILPNYKFETIEKLRLGLTKEKFLSEMKLLKIKNQDFSTNWLLNDLVAKKDQKVKGNNLINSYYTQTFNFDEFKITHKLIEHPALIHTESIDNKTISSIILLLGHTGEAERLSKADSLKGRILYYRQDINVELFLKICELYILKYGEAEMDSTTQIKYYKLYKNNILKENTDQSNNLILRWKTEFFDIEIFSGYNNHAYFIPNEWYSTSNDWNFSHLGKEPLEDNQKPCVTFTHIKYELNSKALKLLGIDKLKI